MRITARHTQFRILITLYSAYGEMNNVMWATNNDYFSRREGIYSAFLRL